MLFGFPLLPVSHNHPLSLPFAWPYDAVTWKPFLLNPQLDASGQDADEYFLTKYGMGPSQVEATRARLK